MTTLSERRHDDFFLMLQFIDELRRQSINDTSSSANHKHLLGMTLRQGEAIAKIKILTMECPQGVSLKTLAKHLRMTVPATSLLVESMVNKGFFERNTNPDDRRAVCIRLAPQGVQLLDEIYEGLNKRLDIASSLLTEEEAATFHTIVQKLYNSIPNVAEA